MAQYDLSPQVNPQNLAAMGNVPVALSLDSLGWMKNAKQLDQSNLEDIMRQHAFEAQMDPLRMEQQRLKNTGMGLENQEKGFTLKSLGRKNEMEEAGFDQQKKNYLQGLLNTADEQHIAAAFNHFQQMALHPDPKIRRQGIEGMALAKDAIEKAKDRKSQEQIHAGNNAATIRAAEIAAGSREKVASLMAEWRNKMLTMKPGDYKTEAAKARMMARDPKISEEQRKQLLEEADWNDKMALQFAPAPAPIVNPNVAPNVLNQERPNPGPAPRAGVIKLD